MVPVDRDRHGRAMRSLRHRRDRVHADVPYLVGMDSDEQRCALLLADVDDAVEHRVVADVEGWDGETLLVRDVQDRLASRQHMATLSSSSGLVAACQALTAPEVRPPMNRRWNRRNSTSTGMEPRMLMAIIW